MTKRREAANPVGPVEAKTPGDISDEEIARVRLERFKARVDRVLAVMKKERVDFRGRPCFDAEGRVRVEIFPADMTQTQA